VRRHPKHAPRRNPEVAAGSQSPCSGAVRGGSEGVVGAVGSGGGTTSASEQRISGHTKLELQWPPLFRPQAPTVAGRTHGVSYQKGVARMGTRRWREGEDDSATNLEALNPSCPEPSTWLRTQTGKNRPLPWESLLISFLGSSTPWSSAPCAPSQWHWGFG
jgi:hypothetical protein